MKFITIVTILFSTFFCTAVPTLQSMEENKNLTLGRAIKHNSFSKVPKIDFNERVIPTQQKLQICPEIQEHRYLTRIAKTVIYNQDDKTTSRGLMTAGLDLAFDGDIAQSMNEEQFVQFLHDNTLTVADSVKAHVKNQNRIHIIKLRKQLSSPMNSGTR